MKIKTIILLLAVLMIPAITSFSQTRDTGINSETRPIGIEVLIRLDLLPQIKSQVFTGMVSSYDRSGGNDDGFSGKYSYLRKEGDELVIAELEGPGVICRMHMPGPQEGIMEFYLDGEKSPRISMKISDIFDGRHLPFLAPLVGSGVGGCYSYVPISYQYSCKIVVKNNSAFGFYDFNYARYPINTLVPTFLNPPSREWIGKVELAGKILNSAGTDITGYLVEPGIRILSKKTEGTITPAKPLELFRLNKPGRILGLRLGPASLFSGKDKDILLKMYWDGEQQPAVNCPVSDFFGYSFGEPAVKSLFLGTSRDTDYIYLPMPFEKSARIELVSEGSEESGSAVKAEVVYARQGKLATEGYFYCYWHRENPCTPGQPYTYLRTAGNGHVVGAFLQARGFNPGGTIFFEGDDVVTLDGQMAIHGTGSEDSYNGGWYDVPGRWEERASFPLSGCLDYKKPASRTGGYRWMIQDTYVFRDSINYTIEHGPEGNLEPADYTSVTFFYSIENPSAMTELPGLAERKIKDPSKIVFVPGWNVPLHSSPFQNAVIEKGLVKVGNSRIRCLILKTTQSDVFGPHQVSFILDLPASGTYRVGIKALQGPDQGIIQMFQHDVPLGKPEDLFAAESIISEVIPLGTLSAGQGDNVVYFRITGKNPASTGTNLCLVEIILERI